MNTKPQSDPPALSGVAVAVLIDYLPEHRRWGWLRLMQGSSALKDVPGLLFSKVMGSAQRRLAGVVLQHGSLLLRCNPAVDGPARHPAVADMVVGPAVPDESGLSRAWGTRIAHVVPEIGTAPVGTGEGGMYSLSQFSFEWGFPSFDPSRFFQGRVSRVHGVRSTSSWSRN